MKTNWYTIIFFKGSSLRSYAIPAACTGNAIAAGWSRLEATEGTRDGWSLSKALSTTVKATPRPATGINNERDWRGA